MLTIALLGHALRNDNLGVGALTVSEVHILREIAARNDLTLQFMFIDTGGARPPCVTGPDIIERPVRPLRRPWQLVSALRDCDLVIDISGGDSFTDIYGNRRIAIIFFQRFVAHLLGKPVVMAPQTVGPFKNRFWRSLARATMRRTALIATRDQQSTEFVRSLGVQRDVIEASDVALRLPYDPPPKPNAGPVRVGLNVSGLLMKGGYSGSNMFGLKVDYPNLIRSMIRDFLSRGGDCELHLVGHVMPLDGEGREDDYEAACGLAHEFPEVIVAPRFVTPSQAKSYIATLDFFMGARMHACIAAFSTGVPVVPMAYSRKFSGLFGSLGYDQTVDCTVEDAERILQCIRSAYAKRFELSEAIKVAHSEGLKKLEAYVSGVAYNLCKLNGHLGKSPATGIASDVDSAKMS